MTLQTELKDYYSGLLIVQYKTATKAVATVKLAANLGYCDGLLQTESHCFDLDTAIGDQLDIIGKIVGVPRNAYGLDLTHIYFEYTTYTDTPAGVSMGRYTDDPYPTDLFRRYYDNTFFTLSDFEMQTIIKIKIIYNNFFPSLKNIKEALYDIFAGAIDVVDNADLTIDYDVVAPYHKAVEIASYLKVLPHPMGIAININYN